MHGFTCRAVWLGSAVMVLGLAPAVGAFRNDRPISVYRSFVQQCLSEKGLEVIGWN